jgi:hypothetical protein
MSKLSVRDLIDLDILEKSGATEIDIKVFLVSRYMDIPEKHVRDMDINVFNMIVEQVNTYMSDGVSKEAVRREQKRLEKLIRCGEPETQKEPEPVEERFDILDL